MGARLGSSVEVGARRGVSPLIDGLKARAIERGPAVVETRPTEVIPASSDDRGAGGSIVGGAFALLH